MIPQGKAEPVKKCMAFAHKRKIDLYYGDSGTEMSICGIDQHGTAMIISTFPMVPEKGLLCSLKGFVEI
jgi:hypothetical protein